MAMSHGDHWQALFGVDFSERLAKLLPRFVQQGALVRHVAQREIFSGPEQKQWPYISLEYGEMPLRCITVIHIDPEDKLNIVMTIYPFTREGKSVDLEITDNQQSNKFEAALQCVTRQGIPLTFFAPLYGVDPSAFETGRKYEFSLAALAYSLKKIEETQFTLTEEPALEIERRYRQEEDPHADIADIQAVDFSIAGLRALLFRPGDNADDAADAEFCTVVEGVSSFVFEETDFCKLDVCFRLRDGKELRTALYASEHILAGYRPEVGDLIQGVLWLQGYPVKSIEDQESWANRNPADSALQDVLFSDEDLADLPVGVAALAKSLIYSGWELTRYENYGENPEIPAYLIERDNRRVNVWVRSYIEGQEPENLFSAEETTRIEEESRGKGIEAALAVVVCKDVGKGYTFKILERETLENKLGSLRGLLLYQQKNLPKDRGSDKESDKSPRGKLSDQGEQPEEPEIPKPLLAEDGPTEFYETFRTLSYDALWTKLAEIRKQRQGERRARKFHERELEAALAKTKKIRHPEKKCFLALAKSFYDVDFIAKAKPDFWQWLEKVRHCPHLHLDVIPQSHAVEPFYNCRWCGATVACACRYQEDQPIMGCSNHWARREATYNDLFRNIFIRPGLCYRCRKDETLGAAYQYGKDRLERLFWRELVEAERDSWSKVQQPDYADVDQLIRANAVSMAKGNFAPAILAGDHSGIIRRILERSLRIKKILRRYGRQDTLKDILIDFVKSYCHTYNDKHNLYPLYDAMYDNDIGFLCCYSELPYTIHLPSHYNNPDMWRSYDLERHPEKIIDMPMPFQLALLAESIREAPLPIFYDARGRARENLAPLLKDYDNPKHDFDRAMEAVRYQDMGLFLKMLVRVWEKDPSFLKDSQNEVRDNLEAHRMLWAIREYDMHVSGSYSGFENSIPKNEPLQRWLLASFKLPDMETFLNKGEIVTNVVGMRHIPWEGYLDLDRYLGKGGFYLLRKPDNPADDHAIMVYLEGFGSAGYIKRALAALLAPYMDRGMEIGAELFARHYPYYDQDMTLFLHLKEAKEPLKTPDMESKYRKRPVKRPEIMIIDKTDQEKALNKAKDLLDEADRWLAQDIGHDRIPDKLRDAVMCAMESWLHGQEKAPDHSNGWHSMKGQFMEAAPDHLRRRVNSALKKVSVLQGYTSVFDAGWALKNQQDSRRKKWRWNAAIAGKQIGTLLHFIKETNQKSEGKITHDK